MHCDATQRNHLRLARCGSGAGALHLHIAEAEVTEARMPFFSA